MCNPYRAKYMGALVYNGYQYTFVDLIQLLIFISPAVPRIK